MREDQKRCEALTRKGYRCKSPARFFLTYEGDRQEYFSCKLHFNHEFRPHPAVARRKQEAKG